MYYANYSKNGVYGGVQLDDGLSKINATMAKNTSSSMRSLLYQGISKLSSLLSFLSAKLIVKYTPSRRSKNI